jgi:hypothetical protein
MRRRRVSKRDEGKRFRVFGSRGYGASRLLASGTVRANVLGVARTSNQSSLPTTLLDLIWTIGADERLSEQELADAIVGLVEERSVRLTGTYRGTQPAAFRAPRRAA